MGCDMVIMLLVGCWPGPLPACEDCVLFDDVDQDGFSPSDGDCNDADPAIRPGAEEICNDGIDNNCDGTPDPCVQEGIHRLSSADAQLVSTVLGQAAGTSLALTPDGTQLVVGIPGNAFFTGGILQVAVPTPLQDGTLQDLTEAQALGRGLLASVGSQLATGPSGIAIQEGDGVLPRLGTVHVMPWMLPSDPPTLFDVATVSVQGTDLGLSLAMGPQGGLLMSSGELGISAFWVETPPTGTVDVATVGVALTGPTLSAVAAGDLNEDGETDLAIAFDLQDDPFVTADIGRVWVFYGPVTEERSVDEADRVYQGALAGTRAGGSLTILADLDDNGRPELAVGAPGGDSVWLLDATVPSGFIDDQAWLRIVGPPAAGLGRAFATPDLNRDGALDLAISAPDPGPDTDAGAVYVFSGPQAPGLLGTDDAELVLHGIGANHHAGQSLAVADLDNDSHDDLILGPPRGHGRGPRRRCRLRVARPGAVSSVQIQPRRIWRDPRSAS